MPHRFVADHISGIGWINVDDKRDEATIRAFRHLDLVRRTADELVIEFDVGGDARFNRRVNRAVLAEPGAEAFFQPQGKQCAQTKEFDDELFTGRHDAIKEGDLILGRDPKFISQITRIREATDHGRDHAAFDLAKRHERESGVRDISVGDFFQHFAGVGSGNGQTGQSETAHGEGHGAIGR